MADELAEVEATSTQLEAAEPAGVVEAPIEQPVEVAAAEAVPAQVASPAASPADVVEPVAADLPPSSPAAPRRRRRLAIRFALSFLIGVALVVGVGAGALYAWSQQYVGRILPGVHAGAVDLSGLTPEAARAAIGAAWTSLGNGHIVLKGPKGNVTIAFADIGRAPDAAAMLDTALAAGRRGEPLADLIGAPQVALKGVDVAIGVTWDQGKLSAALATVADAIDTPAVDATVTTAPDGSFVSTPASTGLKTDRATLAAAVAADLARLDAPAELTIDVPVAVTSPAATDATAADAKAAAGRIIQDLALTYGAERWMITGTQLGALLTFTPDSAGGITPVINSAGLDPLLANIAKAVKRSPRDARLTLVGSTVVLLAPSQDGLVLNVEGTRQVVLDAIAARQAGASVPTAALAVSVTQPKLTSAVATASAPGMVEISRWTTRFDIYNGNGFGANIWIPSKLLTGYVVAPGATFDFLKAIGPITEKAGYSMGGAIINGHSNPQGALGGGICSCSTTLFNAALRAGFKMGSRQNHYYYIDRYPIGLDATVFISSGGWQQSMTWTNDTQNPVLIRGINTRSGGFGYITFVLYSKPTGRTVVIAPAVIKDKVAPVDTTVYTSSLPKGVYQRVEWAIPGMNVWRTITVFQNGKVLRSWTYYSHYARMTGVLEIGTGGAATPKPKPKPTANPTPVPTPAPTVAPTSP